MKQVSGIFCSVALAIGLTTIGEAGNIPPVVKDAFIRAGVASGIDVGPPSRWIVAETRDDEEGDQVLLGYRIRSGALAAAVAPSGEVTMLIVSPEPSGEGGALSQDALIGIAETVTRSLVGALPTHWRRSEFRDLETESGIGHTQEAKGLVEIKWIDVQSHPSDAAVTLRVRKSDGRLRSWAGFVPSTYGPREPSISAGQARERALHYAREIGSRYPEQHEPMQKASEDFARNVPTLVYSWGGRGAFHFRAAVAYAERKEMRLAYRWAVGGGQCDIDANTGELLWIRYVAPVVKSGTPSISAPWRYAAGAGALAAAALGVRALIRRPLQRSPY